ncbi:MAG: FG-GAP repeat protein [Dokdonella sp.]|uniref:FG-GAP repeat protein n=1 Tax=Dokdonella sp. TaxID=2291710 RepID=UPI003F7FFB9D
MNGLACTLRTRIQRTLASLTCVASLACVVPLHAATPDTLALSRSSVPADLRAAIRHALDGEGWVQTQQVTEADPAFDPEFGVSVAVHGSVAMIGAQQARIDGNDGQGAVYVFEKSNGVWSRTQKIVASDGQAYDTFGNAIAFDGDTALIGAYGTMVDGNFSQGAVYVFTHANGTWTQTQKITAADGQMFDNFGYSIGLVGTTAIIGADGATVGANGTQGAAYVYDGSSGTWTNTQKLTASDGGPGDIFGYSVAFDGSRALIGAYGNHGYQGAVYAFGQSGGTWSESQKLVAADGAPNAYFGYATALSGSTLLVGAWGAQPGGVGMRGSAYLFTESNGTWTQTQQLFASDGALQDKFGHSVALQGTTALIGADGWSAATAQGAVYAFDGSSGTFVETQRFVASDGAPADQFGFPVTLDGGTALVGSWLWRSPGGSMPGAAYFFEFNPTPPTTYTIGGSVSGLVGSGLVLRQNGGDDLAIVADGSFTCPMPISDGSHYAVAVSAQPGNPAQTCTVANGSGTVAGANVADVAVTCTTDVVDRIFADGFESDAATLAQTADHTPVAQNSVACGHSNDGTTADNQYWRRYDFSEYGITTAANIASVEVSIEQATGAPGMTVRLYTIPHTVTVDTIDVGQPTPIGQAA